MYKESTFIKVICDFLGTHRRLLRGRARSVAILPWEL